MNRLQEQIFELMCEFDDICRRNNITYYLSGGSVLGALRHGGFIPWDDDADIHMSRAEYEKLEAVIDGELGEGRVLLSHGRDERYNNPVARYMRLDASVIRRNHLGEGTPQGVFLDILILDPVPVGAEARKEWLRKHYVYCELLAPQYVMASRRRNWRYMDISLYREYEARCEEEGREAVLRELESELFSVDESEAKEYCMRFETIWTGISPISWYGKPREVLFEGRYLPVPAKAELQMNLFYGPDWKYIPEPMKQHQTLKLTEIASGNCEREFFQLISREEFKETLLTYNSMLIDQCGDRIESYMDKQRPYIAYINCRIEKRVGECGREALMNDPEKGLEIFEDYLKIQLKPELASNSYYVPLKDELMELLTELLFKRERMQEIKILLNLKFSAESSLPDRMRDMLAAAEDLLYMGNLLDLREYEAAEVIRKRYRDAYPDSLMLIKAGLEIDLASAKGENDYRAVLSRAREVLGRYPEDGELMKYEGDALKGCGEREKAREVYEKAAEYLTNGVMLLELSRNGIRGAAERLQ